MNGEQLHGFPEINLYVEYRKSVSRKNSIAKAGTGVHHATSAILRLRLTALLYGGTQINFRVERGSQDARCVVSVEDNGAGISEPEQEKVFERFHRIPGSPGSGSGLGLAIVREIARNHGADVLLDKPKGGGTRIRVLFSATI